MIIFQIGNVILKKVKLEKKNGEKNKMMHLSYIVLNYVEVCICILIVKCDASLTMHI